MKFVKALEHNGELYKVGDTICATFNTGIAASGTIKEFGSALTARIRLRTTDLSHSSRSVKSLYGNTRVCGRISPTQ